MCRLTRSSKHFLFPTSYHVMLLSKKNFLARLRQETCLSRCQAVYTSAVPLHVRWIFHEIWFLPILGDPGADSGDEEKSKRAEKYMARRKVKNGEKSPWGQCLTRPVPNGRRRSGFWLVPENLCFSGTNQVFWHQSKARTAATVWNWSGKTLSPGALLAVLYFSSCHTFFRPFRLFLVPLSALGSPRMIFTVRSREISIFFTVSRKFRALPSDVWGGC